MSPSCHPDRGDSGFTLIEVTVAMTVLVIVLVLSGTLLFSMKSFAQKQQSFAEPRQTARRAMNYLSYYLRGASDMNAVSSDTPMPNALVTYYSLGGTPKQVTYNNVANANLADLGTDLVTVSKPMAGSTAIKIVGWNGQVATSANAWALFTQGCGDTNDNTTNLALFNRAVGWDATAGASAFFLIYDPGGYWQYYQITSAPASDCAQRTAVSPQVISMPLSPGGLGGMNLNPPGLPVLTAPKDLTCNDGNPCYMTGGIQFVTFRVRTSNGTPRLEQFALPSRLFDPALDNPGTNFTPLLDNVEDMQIAYVYGDGTIQNSKSATRLLGGADYPDNVPNMRLQEVSTRPYDAANVRGVRLSVVARSAAPISTMLGGVSRRIPTATPPEDSAAVYAQGYYHYRLTSTIMLQNRVLGN